MYCRVTLISVLLCVTLAVSFAEEENKPALYKKVGTIARTDRILAISDSCVVYSNYNGLYVFDTEDETHKKVWNSQPSSVSVEGRTLTFSIIENTGKDLKIFQFLVSKHERPIEVRRYKEEDKTIGGCLLFPPVALISYHDLQKQKIINYIRDENHEYWVDCYGFLFCDRKSVFAIVKNKLFGISFDYILRIDHGNMKQIWKRGISAPHMNMCRVLMDDRYVLVTEKGGSVSCLDYETGVRIGKVHIMSTPLGSIIIHEDYLYSVKPFVVICKYGTNGIEEVMQFIPRLNSARMAGIFNGKLNVLLNNNGINVYDLRNGELLEEYAPWRVFENIEKPTDVNVESTGYDNCRSYGLGGFLGRTCVIHADADKPNLIYCRY